MTTEIATTDRHKPISRKVREAIASMVGASTGRWLPAQQ